MKNKNPNCNDHQEAHSFIRDLSKVMTAVRLFKDGVDVDINNCKCHIRFIESQLLCNSSGASLYPRTDKDISRFLEGLSFTIPFETGTLDICIKQSFLIRSTLTECQTETLFAMLTAVEKEKTLKRKVRILIPQASTCIKPDFANSFSSIYNFESKLCETEGNPYLCACINNTANSGITFAYNGIRFLAYYIQDVNAPNNPYMVIETSDEIDMSKVQSIALNIIYAVGFFTCSYLFGPLFVFDAKTNKFLSYNGCIVSSSESKYKMMSLNPYDYFSFYDATSTPKRGNSFINLFGKELKPIEMSHFVKLLSFMESERFINAFQLLQELSTSLSTIVVTARLSVYVICLEMFRCWMKNDIVKDATIPAQTSFIEKKCRIPSQIRARFIKNLQHALKDVMPRVNINDFKSMRENMLGAFTKRLPNAVLLKQPFEYLGIDISSARDENVFTSRNFIAHGKNIIKSKFYLDCPEPYLNESEEMCFSFYSLMWRLIMVAIGYHGHYRDLPKLRELNRKGLGNNGRPLALKF